MEVYVLYQNSLISIPFTHLWNSEFTVISLMLSFWSLIQQLHLSLNLDNIHSHYWLF